MELNALKSLILEDGKIDASEVAQVKELIYADGRIDRQEADFLFELNDGCSGANNVPEWSNLFVNAICDYLLNDEKSPGIVDDDEAEWLISKIDKDGTVDHLEKELLNQIKSRSNSIPPRLTEFINKNA